MSDLTTLLGGGAIIGVVAGAWNYIKVYLNKIYGLMFITLDMEHSESSLGRASQFWTITKCKPFRFRMKSFTSGHPYVKPVGKEQLVGYHSFPKDPGLYFYNSIPIIISQLGMKITFIRWTLEPEKVIQEAIDVYNKVMGDDNSDDRSFIKKYSGSLAFRNGKKSGEGGVNVSGDNEKCAPSGGKVDRFLEGLLTLILWNIML